MKKFPYESAFAGLTIKPMVSTDKDKLLALASLEDIKGFLPNIDTEINGDLLPVAFNACVANRVNKNKDVIDTATAIAMTPSFINKPINVEHNRQKVIGMIMTAGFSEFGTDRPLTADQVKGMTSPFNITLGGVIWRVVCPELADHIEESSDPTSEKYMSVSASWELGFADYRIALMEGGVKNLAEAKKIISDPKEVEAAKDKLTSLGGPGKIEDLFAYRMPSYDVLALGIGFTEKPAAEVKGILTPDKEEAGIVIPEAFDDGGKPTEKPESVTIPKGTESNKVGIVIPNAITDKNAKKEALGEKQNKISQSNNSDVKTERTLTTRMKISSLKDITEDSVKSGECTASAVSDFIASELTKGSTEWEKQKTTLNTQLTEAATANENLKKEQTKLQEELKQIQATVQSLATEKAEREKVEKFNVRMAAVSSEYNLDDEVRAAIVDEIKAIENDEAFTKWQTKAKVLLKGFAKKADDKKDKADDDDADASAKDAKAKKAKADMDDADASKKNAKASSTSATAAAVASAIDNGDKDKAIIPNGSSAAEPSLKDKYKEAFAKENFVITM